MMDSPNTSKWTISDGRYKLIIRSDGLEELYHLVSDPYESENLIDQELSVDAYTAKIALQGELLLIRN